MWLSKAIQAWEYIRKPIKQDVGVRRKVKVSKNTFSVGREKLSGKKREEVDKFLDVYPELTGFYQAKEKIRELYRQPRQNGSEQASRERYHQSKGSG